MNRSHKETYMIVSPQYLPTMGGVERYSFNLAKNLIKRGKRVIIVTSKIEGLPDKEIDKNGIIILRVHAYTFASGRMVFSMPGKSWTKVCAYLDEEEIDYIIIQTCLYTLDIMGMKYAKKRNISNIAIIHGSGFIEDKNLFINFILKLYQKILLRAAEKICEKFYCVSEAGVRWLNTYWRGKKSAYGVIYNAIDINELEACAKIYPVGYWRNKLGIKKSEILVLYAGRVIREKGVVQLVEAVEELGKYYKVKLAVAGEGELYNILIKQHYNNVYLLGAIEHTEVISLLNESDIFCLPSAYVEGMPTSVLEAVAMRCYVITTSNGGAKELIKNEQSGMILENNSIQNIKKGLIWALEHGEERQNAIQEAYEGLRSKFTWEESCVDVENAWIQ